LRRPDSEFIKLLQSLPYATQAGFNCQSLMALGLLICQGDTDEKASVLFKLLQTDESVEGKRFIDRKAFLDSDILDLMIETSVALLQF